MPNAKMPWREKAKSKLIKKKSFTAIEVDFPALSYSIIKSIVKHCRRYRRQIYFESGNDHYRWNAGSLEKMGWFFEHGGKRGRIAAKGLDKKAEDFVLELYDFFTLGQRRNW